MGLQQKMDGRTNELMNGWRKKKEREAMGGREEKNTLKEERNSQCFIIENDRRKFVNKDTYIYTYIQRGNTHSHIHVHT